MKLIGVMILMLVSVAAFAQDTTAARLADLKFLYERKKISLEKYQELSKQLLRPLEGPRAQNEPVQATHSPAVFDTSTYTRTEEYCIISIYGRADNKASIEIDFGQEEKTGVGSGLKNTSGQLPQFDHLVDALNFMNSKGWEVCGFYPTGATLLKRKVRSSK